VMICAGRHRACGNWLNENGYCGHCRIYWVK